MLYSMTGYGKATTVLADRVINTEIRSVNSKTLDLLVRLPHGCKNREAGLRKFLTEQLQRGKVEVVINIEEQPNTTAKHYSLNSTLIIAYYRDLSKLCAELNIPAGAHLLNTIMALPDVAQPIVTELTEEEWQPIEANVVKALEVFAKFRLTEGEALEADLQNSIDQIRKHLQHVEIAAPMRIAQTRTRIKQQIEELLQPENYDPNRFEQELLYYLEKIDINEEIIRLKSHCDYFVRELNDGEDIAKGKTLNFMAQELGREINTIGSKAYDVLIQTHVIQMKAELEKIKEQVLNVI